MPLVEVIHGAATAPGAIAAALAFTKALRKTPVKAFRGNSDYMFIFASRTEIENMKPDFTLLAQQGGRGVIVTAMGGEVDFVSRFFAPQTGIN